MGLNSQAIRQEKAPIGKPTLVATSTAVATKKWLIAILLVATLLRVASAVFQGNIVTDLPGVYDQISYDGLARRVIDGHGFNFATDHWPATRGGEPTAHWSYLYTLYLAAIYKVFGTQPVLARLIQAVIAGVLHSWLAWRIGRRIFGTTTGLVVAALSAVYIYFFYYAGALITETFYIIGILWTLDVALRMVPQGKLDSPNERSPISNRWLWLELGVAIGVTVLFRQLFLLFVPFLFLWLWWNIPPQEPASVASSSWVRLVRWSTLQRLVGATLIVVLMIAPWTARNYRAFGSFVLLNTNAGFAFFWGNHPIYGTHFVGLLPANGPSYYDLIPVELRPLNEADLDRALLKRGIGFVTADPVRYILLSFSRAREYFKFWPSSDSGLVSNFSRVASFGIGLPFMLYGLIASGALVFRPRRNQQRAEILLLYLFMTMYTLIHLLSWALIRYRLPVDAVLLIFAAFGLVDLAKRYPLTHRLTTQPQKT